MVVWTDGEQGVAVVGVQGVTTDDEGEYRLGCANITKNNVKIKN